MFHVYKYEKSLVFLKGSTKVAKNLFFNKYLFQYDPETRFIKGVEDCLMVSVYTPKLPVDNSESLLPVFVWIHGNNFVRGSGNADIHGPNRLMDYGIVNKPSLKQ